MDVVTARVSAVWSAGVAMQRSARRLLGPWMRAANNVLHIYSQQCKGLLLLNWLQLCSATCAGVPASY